MDDYFAGGCRVCWIVDPANRTVAVYRPGRSPILLAADNSLTEEDLLPGFSVPVRAMFPGM